MDVLVVLDTFQAQMNSKLQYIQSTSKKAYGI